MTPGLATQVHARPQPTAAARLALAASLLLHAGMLTAAAWTTCGPLAVAHHPHAEGVAIQIGWSAGSRARELELPERTVEAAVEVPSFAATTDVPETDPESMPERSTAPQFDPLPTFALRPAPLDETTRTAPPPPEPPARSPTALARKVPRPLPTAPCVEPTPAPAPGRPGAAGSRASIPSAVPGRNPAPDYPDAAVRRRLEGTVVVAIAIAAEGTVATCRVARSSGWKVLDDAALAAARRWHFTDGPGEVEQAFTFKLRG